MASSKKFYQLKSLKLGCEVYGITLSESISSEVIESIKKDVTNHRLLVFKNQGVLSGVRLVEVSSWFGTPESTFYQHPKSPHHDVFRVSNDPTEGCTNVGRTGWHIDGSFQEKPFSHSIYHMVSVPSEGATMFAGLREVVERLGTEQRQRWQRLWMMSNRRSGPVHPLIYRHPRTGDSVLCLHLGMTEAFTWDLGAAAARVTQPQETVALLEELHHQMTVDDNKHQYRHEWSPGELIITDNLAVAHEATPETQLPRSKVGLRILHRVTIAGTSAPAK